MATDVSIKLGVTGESDLTSALKGVESRIKNLNSEMKAAVSSMSGLESAEQQAAKKSDILTRSIDATKDKIGILSQQYDKAKAKLDELGAELESARQQFGENSAEALKAEAAYNRQAVTVNNLGTKINNATADMNKMETELQDLANKADTAGDDMDRLGDDADHAGDDLDRMGDQADHARRDLDNLGDNADDARRDLDNLGDEADRAGDSLLEAFSAGAVAGAVQSLMGSISGLVDEMGEYQKIMASLEVSSQKAGYTAGETSDSYRRLYQVLADDQTAATTTANLQALGLAQEDLTTLVDACIGAWATYGDSIPIDGLAESINETINASSVTGTFADVLNWAGGVLEDDFNEQLEKCKTKSERVKLVLNELTRQGLPKAAQQWRDNSKALVQTNDATANMTAALSRVAETLAPATASLKNFAADAINAFMDLMDNGEKLVPVIAGVATAIGTLAAISAGAKIMELVTAFTAMLNPVTLVIAAGAGLAAVIAAVSAASGNYVTELDLLSERVDATTQAINEQADSYASLRDSAAESVAGMQTEMGVVSQYVAELQTITDANGRVKEGYESRAAYLADYINSKVPGAVSASGSEADAIYKVSSALDELIFKRKQEAVINAVQPMYEEALTKQLSATNNLIEAKGQLATAENAVNNIQAKLSDTAGLTAGEYSKLSEQLRIAKDNLAQSQENYNTASATMDNYTNAIDSMNLAMSASPENAGALEQAITNLNTSITKATGENTEALAQAVADMQAQYQAMVIAAASSWDSMSATEQQFWAQSLAQQQTALQEQVNQAREGGVQIPTAVGEGMNLGAFQLTGTAQELYLQALKELNPGADVTALGAAYDTLLAAGIISNTGTVNAAGGSAANAAAQGVSNPATDATAKAQGAEVSSNFASGISGGAGQVNSATSGVVTGAKNTASSGVQGAGFQGLGGQVDQNFASGISGSSAQVFSSVSSMIQGTRSSADSAVAGAGFQQPGSMSALNIDSGFKSSMAGIYTTVQSMIFNAKRSADWTVASAGFPAVGYQMVAGMAQGVQAKSGVLSSAITSVVHSAVNAAKAAAGIHSPSRVMRDEVGVQLAKGTALGIRDGESYVIAAQRQQNARIVKEAGAGADKVQKTWDDASIKVLDKNGQVMDKELDQYTKLLNKLKSETNKSVNSMLNKQLSAVNEFRIEYEAVLAGIAKQQEEMAGKLADYGELFKTSTDKKGNTIFELSDLNAQIKALDRYGAALDKLRKKGVPAGLLDEILSFDVDKGTGYVEKLLSMNDKAYSDYIKAWEKKQKQAGEVAQKFYKDQADEALKTSEKALKDELNQRKSASKQVIDITGELNKRLIAKEEDLKRKLNAVGINEATKEILTEQLNVVTKFRTEYEAAIEEIEKAQTTMADKLKDYGDLFTVVKKDTSEYLEVNDLKKQIQAIEDYGDALEKLKTRGVSESLLDKIVTMDVDKATDYTKKLLAMTDDRYNEYMELWEEKQKQAQAVAQKFYAEELQVLGYEFIDKIPEEMDVMKAEMRDLGVDSIQGLINGMESRSGALYDTAQRIVSRAIAAMRLAADIHSPSKKTRNLVGKPLAQGIGAGFMAEMERINRQIAETVLSPFETLSRGDLMDAAAGVVNGNAGLAMAGAGGVQTVVIPVNLNGKQIAEVVYDPLKQVGRQRGQY